jgi:hypothetical protein
MLGRSVLASVLGGATGATGVATGAGVAAGVETGEGAGDWVRAVDDEAGRAAVPLLDSEGISLPRIFCSGSGLGISP